MSDHSVVVEVVRAIAAVEGVEPHELDYSLYDHVDTEAIRSLATFERSNWSLTFRLPDHEITITGNGEIRVDGERRRQLDTIEFEPID